MDYPLFPGILQDREIHALGFDPFPIHLFLKPIER